MIPALRQILTGKRYPRGGAIAEYSPGDDDAPALLSPGGCVCEPRSGDHVYLRGVIESVHDGFAMVKVDHAAPHAIPQRYDLVAVDRKGLEPWQ